MVKKYGCTSGGAQFCQGCYTMEEESDYVDGNWVRAEDYDALAAQLEELRRHLGTLTPGGSHTCITCAAHCVALEDAAAELTDLRTKLAAAIADGDLRWENGFQNAKLQFEATLREACGLMVRFILEGNSTVEESVDAFLVRQTEYSGVTSNAFTAETGAKDEQ